MPSGRYAEDAAQLAKWLRSGELRSCERVVAGGVSDFQESLPTLFRGENTGTLVPALDAAGPVRSELILGLRSGL